MSKKLKSTAPDAEYVISTDELEYVDEDDETREVEILGEEVCDSCFKFLSEGSHKHCHLAVVITSEEELELYLWTPRGF